MGFLVWDFWLRVWGWGDGFQVSGLGFRAPGFGFRVSGFGLTMSTVVVPLSVSGSRGLGFGI